ncbi:MAG: prolyl oligopeptidase family serine peptidase [Gemmataceae bacterium]|nr:prolyl oligopeptidase family serine peptidase [Gemmataceae bacterium]MCI0741552.1 prolyl oligopeptidase family serine peptidase [Gemmataceae bacterium]
MRFCLWFICGFLAVTYSFAGQPVQYPDTKRMEHYDDYHGVKVHCPYRWLEEDVRVSSEVAAWVEEQAKVTEAYLKTIPDRDKIKQRMTDLWNFEKYSAPTKIAKRYYVYSKNDGLQNQSVYYIQDTLDAAPRVLLDPNQWSKDGTVALTALDFSEDGKRLAYGVSEAGSDWSIVRVLDVDSGMKLDDEVRWVKFSDLSWTHDHKGFFYSRFPEPKKGEKFQALSLNQKLYYHRIGTPQLEDLLIYERADDPRFTVSGSVTEDGKYLVISVGDGTTSRKNKVFIKDLAVADAKIVPVIDDFESVNAVIDNDGATLFVKTDYKAPKGRVVAIDLAKPARDQWKELIPESEATLQGAGLTGGMFVGSYLKDARSQIKLFDLTGKFVRQVNLPGIGSASGFGGRRDETETFYMHTSFAVPSRIYRYDMKAGVSSLFRAPKVKFNPDDYEVKQIFYASKDGTKIPMFITHKKGIQLDGNNPTLLYGYGGFNISMTPTFSIARLVWMEMGGVFAMPNIRGGGEYGKDWHRAAVKTKRQVAYDDFIAAAEWLIANKYTRPEKLAIQGGSNGGLLVGACMTQRPELYGACLPAVGVMDMLRFHKFTAGRYWVDDYGSSDNPEEFQALLRISPYHNLKKGVKYPATLVTTADTDDRVVPSHSFKFIAALQHAQAGSAPVLARIELRAGHGAGRPVSKAIEESADAWAFLVRNLGMK